MRGTTDAMPIMYPCSVNLRLNLLDLPTDMPCPESSPTGPPPSMSERSVFASPQ